MPSEIRLFFLATLLSAMAGSAATLAVQRATGHGETRDPGALPVFEDRFMRDFGLPEEDRRFVRAILYRYQERRREIEGRAAESARKELSDLARTIDAELCAILPIQKQNRYYALLDASAPESPAGTGAEAPAASRPRGQQKR